MSIFILKLLACFFMLIDHMTAVLLPNGQITYDLIGGLHGDVADLTNVIYTIGRGIGRLAFPIFCYMLVEGLRHTRNVTKYLLRMAAFAVISEFPFDFAFYGTINMNYQNVFFELMLGLAVIALIHQVEVKFPGDMVKFNTFSLLIALAGGILAEFLRADYGFFGIMLITAIYVLKDKKLWMCVMFVVLSMFVSQNAFEAIGVLGFVLILFYKGKKGPSMKYAFYAFYPVHLLILGIVSFIWL